MEPKKKSASDAFLDGLGEKYRQVRNQGFEWLLQPGGRGTHESAKDYFHTRGSKALTNRLGTVFAPQVAANLADTAYMGNEVITGSLAKLHGAITGKGTPFFSPYGFNWSDIARNRAGQDQALAELRAKEAEALKIQSPRFAGAAAVARGR